MSISADWVAWATIIGAGVVTVAARASFFVMPPETTVPDWFKRALKYVAAAVLPALILPDVLFRELGATDSINLYRVIAAVVAMAVAWRTASIFATLGAGMGVLWLLKWWSPF
jgi:branched-subunit amino acid transport protein